MPSTVYSVDIYNASELISLSRSPCELQKLWTTPVHVHIAIATEVIQLSHSLQEACFIKVEVWLVTLTDALASNRPCNVGGERIALGHSLLHISFSSPSHSLFWDPLCWPLLYILSILRSVRVDAADLHVICYSVNCTTAKICLTP